MIKDKGSTVLLVNFKPRMTSHFLVSQWRLGMKHIPFCDPEPRYSDKEKVCGFSGIIS